MSLSSVNINKLKRLSLKEVTLPAPETPEPIQIERPPTEEEKTYCKLVALYPELEELVESLDLVSQRTGERIRVSKEEPLESKLLSLANKIIKDQESYTREEIIARLRDETGVAQERAETGFNLMIKFNILEEAFNNEYYLQGSTPF